LEKSSFFKSINGDRKYKAENFAEYFNSFIGNGIFPNPSTNIQATANGDMTVTLKAGKAWINGYIYVNTEDLILPIEVADGVLNRIDRIVLRMDTVGRAINAKVKKGAFASTPVATTLQRDADGYEIALADIYVTKGAISITQSNITDLRLNKDLCGIVHGTVDQVDTTTLFNQYQSWFTQKMQQYNNDLDSFTVSKKQSFTNWYSATTTNSETDIKSMEDEFENEFNTWFASVKGVLSGDVAGNLLNLINTNTTNINALAGTGRTNETVKGNTDAIKSLDQKVTSHEADYVKHPAYAVTTNTGNAYAVTTTPAPSAYVDGMGIAIKINLASTGATTLNWNGLGSKNIIDSFGNAVTNFRVNTIYSLKYEVISGNFIVQGKGGGGNALSTDIMVGATASTSAGAVTGSLSKLIAPSTSTFTFDGLAPVISDTTYSNATFIAGDHNDNFIILTSTSTLKVFSYTGTLVASINTPVTFSYITNVYDLWVQYMSDGHTILCLSGVYNGNFTLWTLDITNNYGGAWVLLYSLSIYCTGITGIYKVFQRAQSYYIVTAVSDSTNKRTTFNCYTYSGVYVTAIAISWPSNAVGDGISQHASALALDKQNIILSFYIGQSSTYNYIYDYSGNQVAAYQFSNAVMNYSLDANDNIYYVFNSALCKSNYMGLTIAGEQPPSSYVSTYVMNIDGDAMCFGADTGNKRVDTGWIDKDNNTNWTYYTLSAAHALEHSSITKNGRIGLVIDGYGLMCANLPNRTLSFAGITGTNHLLSINGLPMNIKETAYWSGAWTQISSGGTYPFTATTIIQSNGFSSSIFILQ
jgi:hypothetical protein